MLVASVFLFCKGLTMFPTGPSACTDEKKKGTREGGRGGTWRREKSEKERETGSRLQLKKHFRFLTAARYVFISDYTPG